MSTPPELSFGDLALDAKLLSTLEALGFASPTAIQQQAIPPLLEGRDVIGRARTGSGKTAAYGIPLLQKVQSPNGAVRALILAPTRELALQVTDALRDLSKQLNVGIVTIYGGSPYPPQLQALRRGVPIVVGTPGRVLDHMQRGSLDLSKLEWLVLDEADEMLRMGFIDAVEAVFEASAPDRQVALLSATMPADIQRVASRYLHDPVELQLEDRGPAVDHIDQQWIKCAQRNKLEVLHRLLVTGPPGATLVFVRTRRGCAEVADALTRLGVAADSLHGDLTQAARERVVHRLRAGGIDCVIATDVAARGIDVDHIGRVINLDIPDDTESYVHRIGRTARAGRDGEAITLVTSGERQRMNRIGRSLRVNIRQGDVPSDDDIARHQHRALQAELHQTLSEGDMEPARAWIAHLTEDEGWTTAEIAAAAVARLAEMQKIDLRGPQLAAAEPAPPPEARPAMEVSTDPHVEIFLPIGERNGLRPGDIVGAFANEADFPVEHLGKITILHRKSFVGMPPAMAQELMRRCPTIEIRGALVRLVLARPDQGERSDDRHERARFDDDRPSPSRGPKRPPTRSKRGK